jgi:NAD(P)-dependent dehydrogenase (short-subunit alcohol dehydrogenase family)
VRELAARGAKKIYAGTRHPGDLGDEFAGLPAEVVPLDVTDLASVRAAADTCPDVSLLVNKAGLFTNKRLVLTDDPEAARREMEVNYFEVLNMTRAFAPVLAANGGGYIANVLSVPAPSPRRSWAAIARPRRPRCSYPASPGPNWPTRAPR